MATVYLQGSLFYKRIFISKKYLWKSFAVETNFILYQNEIKNEMKFIPKWNEVPCHGDLLHEQVYPAISQTEQPGSTQQSN